MIDVVDLVKQGKGHFEWHEICSEYNGYKLYIKVFRDAMKFDNIPSLTWRLKRVYGDDRVGNGVRLPASAHQLQQIAYMLDCMIMTPLVIELIYVQAGIKFDANVNINGNIVAISDVLDVHEAIERSIANKGGDDGVSLISCVGKYWCLMNHLKDKKVAGDYAACNYGWFSTKGYRKGVTSDSVKCWQPVGYAHNKLHWDPSQVIRLMSRYAILEHPNGNKDHVDLHDIALDDNLSYLIHHAGVLKYQAQQGVEYIAPIYKLRPEWKGGETKKENETKPIVEKDIITDDREEDVKHKQDTKIIKSIQKNKPTKNIWQAIWGFIILFLNKFFKTRL